MRYPKSRKPKLSDPRDLLWFPKTYLAPDAKGKTRRFIKGACEVCGQEHELLWANFSRGQRHPYRFRHLKCAQAEWNEAQAEKAKRTPIEEVARRVMRHYQYGAKVRGHEWGLTLSQYIELATQPCSYCGLPPLKIRTEMRAERESKNPIFLHNGIDRMHNDQGYTPENCTTCCTQCNFLKRNMDYTEWVEFLERVRKHKNGEVERPGALKKRRATS